MFVHILKRFIFIILPISFVGVKQFGIHQSGDSGIGFDAPFFISLFLIVIFYIFMIYETLNFIILKKNIFAATDAILMVMTAGILVFLASL